MSEPSRAGTAPPRFEPMHRRIETERLLLTPETAADAPWFAELLTGRGQGVLTVDDARERITQMAVSLAELGIGALVLRVLPDHDPIGYTALVAGRASVEEPELAYELLPRAHGKGYATEAAAALLEAAFDTGRTRIWSTIRPWNAPSLRVIDKLGFERHHVTVDEKGEILWFVCER